MSVFKKDLARSCWRAAATTVALVPIAATETGRARAAAKPAEAPAVGSYEGPVLMLAHPAPGGSVPQDRPVVLFRFAAALDADPVDAHSFTVAVDGVDRSALFSVANDEAWGPLGAADGEQPAIASGAHELAARICSARGVCRELRVAVMVEPSPALATRRPRRERWREMLDLLLAVVRKLIA